jgi:NAD(P)-dependent dehydrogenase (short-subunit alcohol dehydrogenase family)
MNLSIFNLGEKVAIVTGSGRGIGKAIALGLADAGAKMVLVARTLTEIEATADEVRAKGGTALPVRADVQDSQQIASLVSRTIKEFKRIDVLVNNAGGITKVAPVLELSEEIWDADVKRNLKSIFLCSQAVARIMARQNKGSIINIGSLAGSRPVPGQLAYSAAKAGMANLTQGLAIEWGRYNIRVNTIMPGTTMTSAVEKIYQERPSEDRELVLESIPLRRFGRPNDFVGLAIYLASDASEWVTGAIIPADGGLAAVVPARKRGLQSSVW